MFQWANEDNEEELEWFGLGSAPIPVYTAHPPLYPPTLTQRRKESLIWSLGLRSAYERRSLKKALSSLDPRIKPLVPVATTSKFQVLTRPQVGRNDVVNPLWDYERVLSDGRVLVIPSSVKVVDAPVFEEGEDSAPITGKFEPNTIYIPESLGKPKRLESEAEVFLKVEPNIQCIICKNSPIEPYGCTPLKQQKMTFENAEQYRQTEAKIGAFVNSSDPNRESQAIPRCVACLACLLPLLQNQPNGRMNCFYKCADYNREFSLTNLVAVSDDTLDQMQNIWRTDPNGNWFGRSLDLTKCQVDQRLMLREILDNSTGLAQEKLNEIYGGIQENLEEMLSDARKDRLRGPV